MTKRMKKITAILLAGMLIGQSTLSVNAIELTENTVTKIEEDYLNL